MARILQKPWQNKILTTGRRALSKAFGQDGRAATFAGSAIAKMMESAAGWLMDSFQDELVNMVANGSFGLFSNGVSSVPDGWSMYEGTWGGAEDGANDMHAKAGVSDTGKYVLETKATGHAIISDYIPISKLTPTGYRCLATTNGATTALRVRVIEYDQDLNELYGGIYTDRTFTGLTLSGWNKGATNHWTAGTGTTYVRFVLDASVMHSGGYLHIDRFEVIHPQVRGFNAMRYTHFDAYKGSTTTGINVSSSPLVVPFNVAYDHYDNEGLSGYGFNTSTYIYTVTEDGIYQFHAAVLLDTITTATEVSLEIQRSNNGGSSWSRGLGLGMITPSGTTTQHSIQVTSQPWLLRQDELVRVVLTWDSGNLDLKGSGTTMWTYFSGGKIADRR